MKATDPSPSLNGAHAEPPRKKRARKKAPLPEGIRIVPVEARGEPESRGRLGSEIPIEEVQWFIRPWIPFANLTLIVGRRNIGKSTFVAWLAAQAGRTCILPGFEEQVSQMTLPRMLRNKVNPKTVRFLDDRTYTLPRDKGRIASILSGWEAKLLVIDPIDSYFDEGLSENLGPDVRLVLESAFWIAIETGAAVVAIRHPGKNKNNLLVGSRSWGNVPRSIVEVYSDGNKPPRYFIRHEKDSWGQDAPVREYRLEGEPGKPRLFKLLGDAEDALGEFDTNVADPASRDKVKLAGQLLRHMFETQDQLFSEEFIARCSKEGISPAAGYAARKECGVVAVPSGSGAKWVMKKRPGEWPKWTELEKDCTQGGVAQKD